MRGEAVSDISTASGSEDSPRSALLRMMRGYWVSQAIFCAARLGLADLVAEQPKTAAELSRETGLPENSVRRLLRALAEVGVFAQSGDGRFGLTRSGEWLRSDVPGSLHASATVMGELFYPAWNTLLPSLQTGESAFAHEFRHSFFDHFAAHPDLGARFQAMMSDLSVRTNAAVPGSLEVPLTGSVVDVGGGNGSLLAAMLEANPDIRGVLFDRPEVVTRAETSPVLASVRHRITFQGGDFFTSVPGGHDAYLLRWILHDYDDARALDILKACRRAIPAHGRLLVIEQLLDAEQPGNWATAFLDLQMLVLLGGEERTTDAFRALLARAGFELQRVASVAAPMWLLEATPI